LRYLKKEQAQCDEDILQMLLGGGEDVPNIYLSALIVKPEALH